MTNHAYKILKNFCIFISFIIILGLFSQAVSSKEKASCKHEKSYDGYTECITYEGNQYCRPI